jgi:putative ABC transport system permease protein
MRGSTATNFLFLLLFRHRGKHLGVLAVGVLLVMLLSAVMFLAGAVQRDTRATLEGQADLVVQKMRGGKAVDLPLAWAEELGRIAGVTAAVPRVYGRYFHEPNGRYFTVVGIDPFDRQASEPLQRLLEQLDVRAFLDGPTMLVGPGVARFLAENRYQSEYIFKTPEARPVPVRPLGILPAESMPVSNDLILLEIDLARRVLGVAPDQATDIALLVPNELEHDAVMAKAIGQHYDIRVIQKRELAVAYANMFNYRGGVFLLLYLVALTTYLMLLYHRYSLITGPDRREIGILRAVGWSIRQVILLKLAENLTVALVAYLMGVVLAYHFVFTLGAPGLEAVFFGSGNLPVDLVLQGTVPPGRLAVLFLAFVVPFTAAVLVPVWKIAVTDPVEAMK